MVPLGRILMDHAEPRAQSGRSTNFAKSEINIKRNFSGLCSYLRKWKDLVALSNRKRSNTYYTHTDKSTK